MILGHCSDGSDCRGMGPDCRYSEVCKVSGFCVILQKLLTVCLLRRRSCVDFSCTVLQQVQLVFLNAPLSFPQGMLASLDLLCTCALALICMLASFQHNPNTRTNVNVRRRERCIDSQVFAQLSEQSVGYWGAFHNASVDHDKIIILS